MPDQNISVHRANKTPREKKAQKPGSGCYSSALINHKLSIFFFSNEQS